MNLSGSDGFGSGNGLNLANPAKCGNPSSAKNAVPIRLNPANVPKSASTSECNKLRQKKAATVVAQPNNMGELTSFSVYSIEPVSR